MMGAVGISPINTGLQSQHRNTAIVSPGSSLAEAPSQLICAQGTVWSRNYVANPFTVTPSENAESAIKQRKRLSRP